MTTIEGIMLYRVPLKRSAMGCGLDLDIVYHNEHLNRLSPSRF
jgi:hypothetical protein